MTKTEKILTVGIVIALVVGVFAFYRSGNIGPAGQNGQDGNSYGAVPTLDGVDNPFVSIGGVKEYYYSQGMLATSSVVCSIKNPFNATSTLLTYGAIVTSNGIAVTQRIDLSTSTSQYASSSPAFVKRFDTGTGQWSLQWTVGTTTNSELIGMKHGNLTLGSSDVILSPSDYLNLRISTSSPGSVASPWIGRCTGVIKRL